MSMQVWLHTHASYIYDSSLLFVTVLRLVIVANPLNDLHELANTRNAMYSVMMPCHTLRAAAALEPSAALIWAVSIAQAAIPVVPSGATPL